MVVEHRSLARTVDGGEDIAALERGSNRGVELFGGAVIPTDMEQGRDRPLATRREQVTRQAVGEHLCMVVKQRQGIRKAFTLDG